VELNTNVSKASVVAIKTTHGFWWTSNSYSTGIDCGLSAWKTHTKYSI